MKILTKCINNLLLFGSKVNKTLEKEIKALFFLVQREKQNVQFI